MPLPEHPERRAVSDEVHARPYPLMQAPEQASHLALLSGEAAAGEDHACLARLCALVGQAPPPPGINHYAVEFTGAGGLALPLRWARPLALLPYTLFRRPTGADPSSQTTNPP